MSIFVVCGKYECTKFAHCVYIADYLSINLPDFKYRSIGKKKEEWEDFLNEINFKNNWNHTECPLIWKEVSISGGKAYYIGTNDVFWEYCFDYYRLESIISKFELAKLISDKDMYYEEKNKIKSIPKHTYTICLYGELNEIMSMLIIEILKLETRSFDDGLNIYIYDTDIEESTENLSLITEQLNLLGITNFSFNVELVFMLDNILNNIDLLIYLTDLSQNQDESYVNWIKRNYTAIDKLANIINFTSKRFLKVIFANHGPVCFDATIFSELVTSIKRQNIVAVTADLGLSCLSSLSKTLNIPITDLGAPPVWGFIGINQFIDIGNTIQCYKVFRPNKRAVTTKVESVFEYGKRQVEIRHLEYLTFHLKEFWGKMIEKNKNIINALQRKPMMPKIRAVSDLLRYWFSDITDGEIISLGVLSDGTFGIPSNMIFSQPVTLENKEWKPCKEFPQPNDVFCKLQDLYSFAQIMLNKTYYK